MAVDETASRLLVYLRNRYMQRKIIFALPPRKDYHSLQLQRKVWRMKESSAVEFKREMTKTFLKTVSAFANYGDGDVVFGVDDSGNVVGVDDACALCLDVENSINDCISPMPIYTLEIQEEKGLDVVILHVKEGPDKPYLYRGKAYRRSSTADVEADRVDLVRLILEGRNLSFEEIPSRDQNLRFDALNADLKERAEIDAPNMDVYKTLRLYTSHGGFNNAAAVLADKNDFAGIDIVRFGSSINEILERERHVGESALVQLKAALAMYRRYYQYEKIEGATRNLHERIPEEAFREAVANALVHRVWDSPANIQVSMNDSGIRVVSPGGLPGGLTYDEYVEGRISVLRNPIVGNVFFRLSYIEAFGTGVARIRAAYESSTAKPRFSVTENTICVELPVITERAALTDDERRVLALFDESEEMSRRDLEKALDVSQAKAGRIIKLLVDKGAICKRAGGRSTRYVLA